MYQQSQEALILEENEYFIQEEARFKTIYLYDVHCKNINLTVTSKITETGVKFYFTHDMMKKAWEITLSQDMPQRPSKSRNRQDQCYLTCQLGGYVSQTFTFQALS